MKSTRYKGVYQRKNGTWYYRIKKKMTDGKFHYMQYSGFDSEQGAYEARRVRLQLTVPTHTEGNPKDPAILYDDFFRDFLSTITSKSAVTKYKSLYKAQVRPQLGHRMLNTVKDSDVEVILMRMALLKYSKSYISSVRKLLKKMYMYANIQYGIWIPYVQTLDGKPWRLRLLSLFSGIGAPEQALTNLGIDYDLTAYCEYDKTASKAYSLMHRTTRFKNYIDITKIKNVNRLADCDMIFFGFPCQDISNEGNKAGLRTDGKIPWTADIIRGEVIDDDTITNKEKADITRSGLVYKALQIVLAKMPMFAIAENVTPLLGGTYKAEFDGILRNLQDAGYNIYFQKLNAKDFGVPQNRPRAFIVMIRSDLNMTFNFPEPRPLTVRAEDWFEKEVAEEYYIPKEDFHKLNRDSFIPNYRRDIISCLTTNSGNKGAGIKRTYVKEGKRIRFLSSEELMRFQGFPPEYGTLLRNNGISKNQIGKFVGNSITVPVVQAVFESMIEGLQSPMNERAVPEKRIVAKYEKDMIEPLFTYPGNKIKLLPYLGYLMPKLSPEYNTFIDLFGGSAAVAVNVLADEIIINERDNLLIGIYQALSTIPAEKAWGMVMDVVKQYDLRADNQEGYVQCRKDFNAYPMEDRPKYWYHGLAMIYHSYNRSAVKYNKKGGYNASFGKEKCHMALSKEKFFPFANCLFNGNFKLICDSYKNFTTKDKCLDEEYFYYVDPPYLITEAPYNAFWTEQDDRELYEFLDKADSEGVIWMLSNVLYHKGKRNDVLYKWLCDHETKYHIYYLNKKYKGSTEGDDTQKTQEIAVTNYPFTGTHF